MKLNQEGYIEVSKKIGQLKMKAKGGKMRSADVEDDERLFKDCAIGITRPALRASPKGPATCKCFHMKRNYIKDDAWLLSYSCVRPLKD